MDIAHEHNDCTGCGCCAAICPVGCIAMVEDGEGFVYPKVDDTHCLSCGRCVRACPANTTFQRREYSYFMAQHRDEDILRSCSSGGVFDALSADTLDSTGVVFGAVWGDALQSVTHTSAIDVQSLAPMRLSKYAQSSAWESYGTVRSLLDRGVSVLFTGTPCQIAALYTYLGSRYIENKNLITMEVLCHGVTSRKIIESYCNSMRRRHHGSITGLHLRTKATLKGWEDSSHATLVVQGRNRTFHVRDRVDSLMYAYGSSLCLRESCYRCKYCHEDRIADVMAGDFWGVGNDRMPRSQRKRGVSLLALAEDKKDRLFVALERSMEISPIGLEEAVPRNGALMKPAVRPSVRDEFFKHIETSDFQSYVVSSFWKNMLKRKARAMLGPKIMGFLRRAKTILIR